MVKGHSTLWNQRRLARGFWKSPSICCIRSNPIARSSRFFRSAVDLGFPPSTTRRLLKTMMSRRLVQQDAHEALSSRAGTFLSGIRREGRVGHQENCLSGHGTAARLTGENTILHEFRDGKRVCMEKVESKQVLRDTMRSEISFPPMRRRRQGAARASSRPMRSREYLDSAKRAGRADFAHDHRSQKLSAELSRIKRKGFAFSCGERVMDGLCAISAPIFDMKAGFPIA